MATGRRKPGAGIGAVSAVAVVVAISLGLFHASKKGPEPLVQASLGAIPAEGRLVLRVLAPKLY
ncbi:MULTISPECIES: hypothetical protein [unclassified Novosphingobium]|uniref:hypothetical protein n=1 Tax=unclassified Novosphingobium TaxID=2644732 RepID=UPI00135C59B2|nr:MULTISPECIES: hypothetical protein [unclassified Novosphingobium]